MSPEERKKQLTQVITLVSLLGVLIALFMIVAMPVIRQSGGKKTKPKPAAGQQQAAQPAAATTAKPATSATDMPKVMGKAGAGVQAAPGVENVGGVPTGLNPNLFQVFDLAVPRNPFVQQEEWYADKLNEQVPGYPELRDSGYFNSMEPYLPDITGLFGNRDWQQVQIQRTQKNAYSVSGASADGTIETNIALTENVPTQSALSWTPDSGIPLASLSDPDYVAGLDLASTGGDLGGGNLAGGMAAAPGNGDLFQAPGGGTLPNVDDFLAAGGGNPDQLGPSGALLGVGDQLTCRGVNITRDKASALLDFNGAPFLVKTGDVLPTHYEVLDVKEDGVMIKELRDGSTMWLPLTLLMEPAAKGQQAKK
jgi:hypothetical protein